MAKIVVSAPLPLSLEGQSGQTHLRGTQTGGAIGVFEGVIAAGAGVHWHTHTREDEIFRVLAGEFRFWCGDDVVDGGPGTTLFGPRQVRHRWQNVGSTAGRLLFAVTPGGFESFFDDIAALGKITPQAIYEIETRYGVISEILAE